MRLRQVVRPGLRILAALTLATSPASASEMHAAAGHVAGIVVHDANETLRDYCRQDNGKLVLDLPGGSHWELITSVSDAAITNPGDGAFHVFEPAEIAAALDGVSFPLRHVSAEVFILPFPRRASLESAAGPGLILLSPGTRTLSREHQHAELVHELGHVVQYALLPDTDQQGWAEYARLRGLQPAVNTASAPHADRPHEIWAEDFRALFGDAAANSTHTIENATLAYPTQVAGLDRFIQELATSAAVAGTARLIADPLARGAVGFSRFGTNATVLDVYDAAGRRIASVQPTVSGNSVSWSWNGTDRSGRVQRGAVLFARARDGVGGAVRAVLLP